MGFDIIHEQGQQEEGKNQREQMQVSQQGVDAALPKPISHDQDVDRSRGEHILRIKEEESELDEAQLRAIESVKVHIDQFTTCRILC